VEAQEGKMRSSPATDPASWPQARRRVTLWSGSQSRRRRAHGCAWLLPDARGTPLAVWTDGPESFDRRCYRIALQGEDWSVSVALDARSVYSVVHQSIDKMSRNHAQSARGDLEHALTRAPEDPHLLSCYGWCVALLGEIDRGIGLCERALRCHPDDPMLRLNLGRTLRLAGENKAAHRAFLRAWQQNKRDPAPAAELARMGIRRPPILGFLPRGHWCNRMLGKLRSRVLRSRRDMPLQLVPR
jgi:tetratricopeptide (TPR) repeat protein